MSFFKYLFFILFFTFNVNSLFAVDGEKNSLKQENKEVQKQVDNLVKNNVINKKEKDDKNIHIVQNGENIYRIALKYKITQKDLVDANNLTNASIYVGQKLILPKNAVIENNIKTENGDSNNQENKSVAENEKLNQVENTEKQAQKIDLINKIEKTTFIWPSRGIILSKFGHKTNNGKLEGVNIGGETGSVVRASSSGEVVYNGEVIGYDNVILIRHYNGFITAYGHTEPLVSKGDKVKKGQIIAYMTKNKQSKRSILYFSMRKNGMSYDPEKLIQTKISN